MFSLTPALKQFFTNQAGLPLVGGQLFSYVAGTTTPTATYTDETGATPNTNPVVLDAYGSANVWMTNGSYKFVLEDSVGNVIFTQDQVLSPAAQIAAALDLAGALAALNNLSDLNNVATALVNLGISPFTTQLKHAITNGQSATNLTGETFDGTVYTSMIYNYEIIQGTTILATGDFSVSYLNGTWVLNQGTGRGTAHGITLSLTQATSIGQIQAAESGSGNGTIKLKRHPFGA